MTRIILALLALAVAACEGYPLTVDDSTAPAPACTIAAAQPTDPVLPCQYQLPPGKICAEVSVYIDGTQLAQEGFQVICSAGRLVLNDASLCNSNVQVKTCEVQP